MNFVNRGIRERARVIYYAIRSFLASHSPWIWDATNYKSHRSSRFMTESSLATRSPSKMASYSASLLEIANENLTT